MSSRDNSSMSRRNFLAAGSAFAGSGILGLSGCASGGDAGTSQTRSLRFAYEGPDTTAQGIAADMFQKKLEGASGGKLTIAQYPNAQLGGEPELLQKIRSGDLDFIISSTANAAQIAVQSGVFSLHYLFKDQKDVKKVVADDAVNSAYKNMVEKTVKGTQALTLFTLPLRNFYSKSEVRSVDDIKGRKIRVQATETEDAIFKAYGAVPVHMPFPELYSALQTGVVDLAENAVTYYGLNKHYEVAPVMSFSQHEANMQVLWVSDKTWSSLPDQEKSWVQAAATKVKTQQPAAAFDLMDKLQKKYQGMGVEFVDNVDKESFSRISVPMQKSLAQDLGDEAVEILRLINKVTGAA